MMDDSTTGEQWEAGDDFGVEITELEQDGIDRSSKTYWLAPKVLEWQRSPNRRHWRLVSTVCIVSLLVVIFSLSNGLSSFLLSKVKVALFPNISALSSLSAASFPTPLPGQDGIACLRDAAWSPDGKYVAVLGYRDQCPQGNFVPSQVNIYAAQTSVLLTQLHLDSVIYHTLDRPFFIPMDKSGAKVKFPGGTVSTMGINYVHVLWSPDVQRLAVTFQTVKDQLSVNGVVLVSMNGRPSQVLLQHLNPSTPFYAEWDLERNVPVAYNAPPSLFPLMPLPPALSYHWGAHGTLVPEKPLTDTAVAVTSQSGPIGNPDGGTSFSIWQPGVANFISLEVASEIYGIYTWNTGFAAWSPDGRYLVDEISLSGFIKPAGERFPSREALASSRSDRVPLLPVRDAALLKIVNSDTAVAWNSNGRLLAAYNARNIVNLYDTATGRELESFYLHTRYPAPSPNAVIMRWSPDGSTLLISSVTWDLVSLWKPQ